jgi:hypothetical protein
LGIAFLVVGERLFFGSLQRGMVVVWWQWVQAGYAAEKKRVSIEKKEA